MGLNEAVMPVVAETPVRDTVPANPSTLVTVMDDVPEEPWGMDRNVGLAPMGPKAPAWKLLNY